ncbi:MAG: lactate utilization protein [Thermodesulfobacteriota bacterium]
MNNERVVSLFMENATKCGAETFLAASLDEAQRLLDDLLRDAESIFCPGAGEKERALVIPPDRREEDYHRASVCVEEVFGAVAETGSIVSTSEGGRAVQAGLLPAHHVAVVSQERIYETVEDLFALWGREIPTNVTLETGPSRTADIELTLTIGVHGPERLTIIVVP